MNLYPFRIFIPQEKHPKAFAAVKQMKLSDTFKYAKFDVYIPSLKTEKLIVCLGQKHTVHRGSITRWGAKHIGKTQARLFSYYRYFHQKFGIDAFGAEGVIAKEAGSRYKYHDDQLNEHLEPKEKEELQASDEAVSIDTVRKILKRLALQWYVKMRAFGHDLNVGEEQIAPYSSVVNGLRLYSYVADEVTFYPIEGESAYMKVSEGVRSAQEEMIRMKNSNMHLRSALLKNGKQLTKEEYDAMIAYNELSHKFNTSIKSKYREQASIELALEKLQTEVMCVFTMGIGHRSNYLSIIPSLLKYKDVGFVLITPPELYFWRFLVNFFAWSLALTLIVTTVVYYMV